MTTKLDMLTKLKKQKCLDNSDLLEDKKKMASIWFASLRDEICKCFEEIENSQLNKNTNIKYTTYDMFDIITIKPKEKAEISRISCVKLLVRLGELNDNHSGVSKFRLIDFMWA